METTRLSSNGQVILPKSLRDAHRWAPGTEFVVDDRPEGVLLRPKKPFPATDITEVVGSAGYEGPPKSLVEMDAALERGVRERHARGRY